MAARREKLSAIRNILKMRDFFLSTSSFGVRRSQYMFVRNFFVIKKTLRILFCSNLYFCPIL